MFNDNYLIVNWFCISASATVVPCLTTMISSYGSAEQKGTVMGIFRSLGALARAVGPMLASTREYHLGPPGLLQTQFISASIKPTLTVTVTDVTIRFFTICNSVRFCQIRQK